MQFFLAVYDIKKILNVMINIYISNSFYFLIIIYVKKNISFSFFNAIINIMFLE